jgi:hypothetical protein
MPKLRGSHGFDLHTHLLCQQRAGTGSSAFSATTEQMSMEIPFFLAKVTSCVV